MWSTTKNYEQGKLCTVFGTNESSSLGLCQKGLWLFLTRFTAAKEKTRRTQKCFGTRRVSRCFYCRQRWQRPLWNYAPWLM